MKNFEIIARFFCIQHRKDGDKLENNVESNLPSDDNQLPPSNLDDMVSNVHPSVDQLPSPSPDANVSHTLPDQTTATVKNKEVAREVILQSFFR